MSGSFLEVGGRHGNASGGQQNPAGVKAASAACWACPEKTLKCSDSGLSRSSSRFFLRRRSRSFRSVARGDRCRSQTEVWASPSSLGPVPPAASHRFAFVLRLHRSPPDSVTFLVFFFCVLFLLGGGFTSLSHPLFESTQLQWKCPIHIYFCSLCPVWRTSESQPSLRETGDLRAQGEVPPSPSLRCLPPPFSVRLQMVLVLEGLALLPSDPRSSFQLCLPSCVLHSSAVAAAVAWHRCCSASMSSNQRHQAGRVCPQFTSNKCRTWKQALKIVKKRTRNGGIWK